MSRIYVSYRLPAFYRFDDKSNVWVSWTTALGLFSQGETKAQAKTSLQSAVTLYLKTCQKRGILDRELNRRGAVAVEPGEGEALKDGGHFIEVVEHKDAVPFDITVSIDLLIANAMKGEAAGAHP